MKTVYCDFEFRDVVWTSFDILVSTADFRIVVAEFWRERGVAFRIVSIPLMIGSDDEFREVDEVLKVP